MEMRQLEAFAAVMSTGSVTGAARLLARSQPAVTRLVQELEAEIGYPLFLRNGPRVTPTVQGFRLHEDAERALASLRLVHARAADIALGLPEPMLLAATSALAVGLLPQALKQVEARSGATPVQLRTAGPERVMQSVLNGEVQLGISSLPLEHRGLDVQWIGQLDCVAVLRRGDPLARLERVPLAALAARRLITMSNPYRLRHRLDAVLAEVGERPGDAHALIETNSSINAQALVRAGLGIAVLEPLDGAWRTVCRCGGAAARHRDPVLLRCRHTAGPAGQPAGAGPVGCAARGGFFDARFRAARAIGARQPAARDRH